jgi:hypothetical protein
MPLRARLFIIISLIVFVILSISIFLVIRSKKIKNTATPATVQTTTDLNSSQSVIDQNGSVITSTQAVIKTLTTEEVEKNSVRQMAKIFIERYSSYSTDNKYQNIIEVKSLCSQSLYTEISAIMNSTQTGSFFGVTTQVLSSKITAWDKTAGTAGVEIRTKRTEEKNGATSVYYQDATVEMTKASSGWLVNKFKWLAVSLHN